MSYVAFNLNFNDFKIKTDDVFNGVIYDSVFDDDLKYKRLNNLFNENKLDLFKDRVLLDIKLSGIPRTVIGKRRLFEYILDETNPISHALISEAYRDYKSNYSDLRRINKEDTQEYWEYNMVQSFGLPKTRIGLKRLADYLIDEDNFLNHRMIVKAFQDYKRDIKDIETIIKNE